MSKRFNEFVAKLIATPPDDPPADLERIFHLWLRFTSARWALFWMGCNRSKSWDIRFAESVDREAHWSDHAISLDDTSVAQFCVDSNKVAFVDSPSWSRKHRGKHYRVKASKEIAELGIQTFQCIPMTGSVDDTMRCGAVCLHYDEDYPPEKVFTDDELLILGRLSWIQIQLSLKYKQQRILSELNELEAKCTKQNIKRPAKSRTVFAKRVVKIIERELHAKAVSLFYRDDDHVNELSCLATSHEIYDTRSGVPIEVPCEEVSYTVGEGATGRCYETGEVLAISVGEDSGRNPRFVEGFNGNRLFPSSTVFCPILPPGSKKMELTPVAMGVVRCVEPMGNLVPGGRSTFDAGELETLQFLSSQLAPALESLAARVTRERTISIVKHDLIGPISLIRHIADDLETSSTDAEGIRYIPFKKLMNIKSFALAASHLVMQLDPTQSIMSTYSPKRTFLGGEIVARLAIVARHLAWEENSMKVEFDDFRDLPPLWVDKSFVERVLFNLLNNAIKYGASGSTIHVRPRTAQSRYIIEVINEGSGVAEKDKSSIFQEHFRAKDAQHKKVGLGLGLYISRRAMIRHGGDLVLARAKDPTIFQMYFPKKLDREAEK